MKQRYQRKQIAIKLLCLAVILLGSLSCVQSIQASERALDVAKRHGHNLEERYQPVGSVIAEIHTGQILWEENGQVSWAPASMTKLMTILVAYDAMAQGKFSLETEVKVTPKYMDIASRYSLSNNKMQPEASYTVSELIDLVIVPSSAAATYMLADLVEPDPDRFVAMMNQKAAYIGMNQTTYYNSVGVPNYLLEPYQPQDSAKDSNNISSPIDYALLCSYFVKTYPEILEHTKHPQIVVKQGTPYEETFDTYQISVEGAKYGLEGTDGLKTGSSGDAGFNYSSTAKRGDTRLVEIIMGVSTWTDQTGEEIRHLVGNAIMEEAFAKHEYRIILPKGMHEIGGQKIIIENDFWDCVPKDEQLSFVLKDGKVKADLQRNYLPGYQEPAIAYRDATKTEMVFNKVSSESSDSVNRKGMLIVILIVVSVAGAGIFIFYCMKLGKKRRRSRGRQRRTRGKK